jgi:hypothetical protein
MGQGHGAGPGAPPRRLRGAPPAPPPPNPPPPPPPPPIRRPQAFATVHGEATALPVLLYSLIIAVKAAQAALLLRRPGLHARWRKGIIWTERALRTLVSVRMAAFARGARAAAAAGAAGAAAAAAGGGGGGDVLKALVLSSGVTVAYWNSERARARGRDKGGGWGAPRPVRRGGSSRGGRGGS